MADDSKTGYVPGDSVGQDKMEPNCGECGGKDFTGQLCTFAGTEGVLVYCQQCGAVVGWGSKRK
jgi:hypothetical protein